MISVSIRLFLIGLEKAKALMLKLQITPDHVRKSVLPVRLEPGLFTMRLRRHGESLFHWGITASLWFRQVTPDVKLTNSQNLSPRPENRFKRQTRRLSS
jgi:hypothetical protein